MLPVELLLTASARSLTENTLNAPSINLRNLMPGVISRPPAPLLAALTGKLWQPGRTLRVAFLDGYAPVHRRVKRAVRPWTEYANVSFEFLEGQESASDAELRISFGYAGSWSYIGTDALAVPRSKPTMNLGWLSPETDEDELNRVVLHEFGHALGCLHEHQSPAGGIPWDYQAVYEYYQGPPNYWTIEQIDTNILERYDETITQFSAFDRHSIMLYPIPQQFTVGDFAIGWNDALSHMDKQYISALYPFRKADVEQLSVNQKPAVLPIRGYGEVDTYTFSAIQASTYRIETRCDSHVVVSLFGPNDDTHPIARADNANVGESIRLVVALEPGDYTVRVMHKGLGGVGDYLIGVWE